MELVLFEKVGIYDCSGRDSYCIICSRREISRDGVYVFVGVLIVGDVCLKFGQLRVYSRYGRYSRWLRVWASFGAIFVTLVLLSILIANVPASAIFKSTREIHL